MPPVSRIDSSLLEPSGVRWMMAAPLGQTGRLFLWHDLVGTTRREVLRKWQAIYRNLTWRQAYRRGWRVVRVRFALDASAALTTIIPEGEL